MVHIASFSIMLGVIDQAGKEVGREGGSEGHGDRDSSGIPQSVSV